MSRVKPLAVAPQSDCHWIRVFATAPLGNGPRIGGGGDALATLRNVGIKALMIDGNCLITEGTAAIDHHTKRLLRFVEWREPAAEQQSGILRKDQDL